MKSFIYISRISGLILGLYLLISATTSWFHPWAVIPMLILMGVTGYKNPKLGIGMILALAAFPDANRYFEMPALSWSFIFLWAFLAGYLLRADYKKSTVTILDWGILFLSTWAGISACINLLKEGDSFLWFYFSTVDGIRGVMEYPIFASQEDYGNAARAAMTMVMGFIFFYVIKGELKSEKDISFWLKALVLGSVPVICFSLFQYLSGSGMVSFWLEQGEWRLNGTFGDPNSYATYLLIIIPVTVALTANAMGKLKSLLLVLLLCQAGCLILTESRNAILAFFVELMVAGVLYQRYVHTPRNINGNLNWVYRGAICLLFGIPALLGYLENHPDRMIHFSDYWADTGPLNAWVNGRVNIWASAVKMIRLHPFTGIGTGRFYELLAQYRRPDIIGWNPEHENAHNYFLQLGAENGLIFLLVFVGVLSFIFKKMLQNFSLARAFESCSIRLSLLAVFTGITMSFLGGHSLVIFDFAMLFWGLAAMALWPPSPDNNAMQHEQKKDAHEG